MDKKKQTRKKKIKILIMLIVVAMIFTPSLLKDSFIEEEKLSYNDFLAMVEENRVEIVEIDAEGSAEFTAIDTEKNEYIVPNPRSETFKEFLLSKDIEVKELGSSKIIGIISDLISTLITVGLMFFIFSKMLPDTGDKGEAISRIPETTFDDIAGEQELKNDLKYIVDYLKNPDKYKKMGARMPKGIVLYGPPGTGKTLTAKAIAGTANVPFFNVSGSDFVEMYAGLGAKRVRNLYKNAREKAPCIVFIDEIDAIGGKRNGMNSHAENDQTINALLNELDGFSGLEGVLTIAATNRLDQLDPALIRPGRFDKHLAVPLPEKEDRLTLLDIYSKGKNFASDVNFKDIASMTVGFSGAAIEAMLNEAAFMATSEDCTAINMEHIDRAFYKIVMKGDRKDHHDSRDKNELKICSWHESGHALATKLYTNDHVPKVTVIASTSGAGGVTFRTPEEMSLMSKEYIESSIKILYAGRAAELILLGDKNKITTGASQDIKQATEIIKDYLTVYGMDEDYGLINTSVLGINLDEQLLKKASELSTKFFNEVLWDLEKYEDALKELADNLYEKESINENLIDTILEQHNIQTKGEDKI